MRKLIKTICIIGILCVALTNKAVAAGQGALFFYNASTGLGATATLDGQGKYLYIGDIPGFAKRWTHIVSTSDGALFFYNASTGLGATATLDGQGKYHYIGDISGFATGWTHIVGTTGG